jgi:Muconolactone delta-isomerase
MKYLVNGTLRPERTREDLLARIGTGSVSDEAWDLVRRGVITAHGYKVGERPGFVLVVECESDGTLKTVMSSIPLVRDGWFHIEVDPLSPFVSDIR